ncbi:hypothetical protein AKJ41_05430 [candidate division MSBL1 archaeon SCGC-AAA259O05]|uniref:Uncharacterized protein n=1 Tax=candidate division MSBL1 archaeon SCGC-AAA259O05 TaxID=1698271 RepID=A0A133UZ27_9EURY|nr:hypothetical protein AKJ41_05430 [candidate division MSBL1 archaeon SCGC-AAA259O05]
MSSEAEGKIKERRRRNREALHILPGDICGTGDLLKVARTEAKKRYGWESVRMLEWIGRPPDGSYVVLVEPKSLPDDVVGEPVGKAGAQGEDGVADVPARDVAGPRQKEGEKSG